METDFERILTSSRKADLVAFMAAHPEHFAEAVDLALADRQPYSWRAAWLLWSCMEPNDKRIRGHVNQMIRSLPDRNDNSHQRELLMILQRMELTVNQEGRLFDHCISLWKKVGKAPSLRFNAFRLIMKIASRHPELLPEVRLLLQDHYLESLSKTVQRSVNRLLDEG